MRIDKFLKVSRIIKRRTVANDACDAAHVSVNGRTVKASYDVKEGDSLDEEFMSWGYPLAESQARKAGYRLAKVLNIFFN